MSSAPPIDTTKRVALITGCSEPNSLGAAFARELLARHWTVFVSARKIGTLAGLGEAGCHTLELDVCSDDSVAEASRKLVALTGGRLDLLINNASLDPCATGLAPLVHTKPAKLAAMHDLHVLGPLRLTQALFPSLRETARRQSRRCKIVNIGSVISNGMPFHAAYASTKAGAQVLSDVMRREFEPVGIDVITVELALVKTAMSTGAKNFDLDTDIVDHDVYDARKAIEQATKEFDENGLTAPPAVDIARDIVNAVEKNRSPGKLYLGKQSYVFRHVLPHLPTAAADMLTSKLFRVDLVQK